MRTSDHEISVRARVTTGEPIASLVVVPKARARRRLRNLFVLGFLVSLVAPVLVITRGASASIGVDREKIRALEATIAAEGAKVQDLVSAFDTVDGRLEGLDAAIKHEKAALVTEQAAQDRAESKLRGAAVLAYTNAASGNSSSLGTFFNSSDATALPSRETYLGFASGTLNAAVTTLVQDQYATSQTEKELAVKQAATKATLDALATSRAQVQSAINADKATLQGLDANELAQIDAANAARAAAEARAAENVLAAEAAQQAAPPPAASSPVSVVIGAGHYVNPLRGVSGLSPNRIDQGVDYDGFGPVYALGDGVVLSVVNGGWPGGTFICYRLTDGPASGLVVYVAEDLNPEVQIGESVTPRTVLGTMFGGTYGIETGWAQPAADGDTMAAVYGQYYGSNTTAFGDNFSQLLSSLGAPGGQLQNSPTGYLPSGWPTW